MKDKRNTERQERMLYRRMKQAEEAIEEAEEMMENERENESMNCNKRKCEMGKRKPCK